MSINSRLQIDVERAGILWLQKTERAALVKCHISYVCLKMTWKIQTFYLSIMLHKDHNLSWLKIAADCCTHLSIYHLSANSIWILVSVFSICLVIVWLTSDLFCNFLSFYHRITILSKRNKERRKVIVFFVLFGNGYLFSSQMQFVKGNRTAVEMLDLTTLYKPTKVFREFQAAHVWKWGRFRVKPEFLLPLFT